MLLFDIFSSKSWRSYTYEDAISRLKVLGEIRTNELDIALILSFLQVFDELWFEKG
jgi:hypothetical protein